MNTNFQPTPKPAKTRLVAWLAACVLAASASFQAVAAPADDYFAAIKNDNDGAVVTLLFRGLDVNTVDDQGRHGLHLAMMEGSNKVAKTLLDLSGTQVNTLSKQGESPLMIAALKGNLAMAKRLIAKGADVNKTGWTPLHYAATSTSIEMVDLLLDEDAYIDAESPNKSTPLMMAAMYGTDAMARLLMEEGADPSIKNDLGFTAADFAAQADRKVLAAYIAKAIKDGLNPKTNEPGAVKQENKVESKPAPKQATAPNKAVPVEEAGTTFNFGTRSDFKD